MSSQISMIELPPPPFQILVSALVLALHMQRNVLTMMIVLIFFIHWTHLYDEILGSRINLRRMRMDRYHEPVPAGPDRVLCWTCWIPRSWTWIMRYPRKSLNYVVNLVFSLAKRRSLFGVKKNEIMASPPSTCPTLFVCIVSTVWMLDSGDQKKAMITRKSAVIAKWWR